MRVKGGEREMMMKRKSVRGCSGRRMEMLFLLSYLSVSSCPIKSRYFSKKSFVLFNPFLISFSFNIQADNPIMGSSISNSNLISSSSSSLSLARRRASRSSSVSGFLTTSYSCNNTFVSAVVAGFSFIPIMTVKLLELAPKKKLKLH
jgi:hypothetical protein